nr:site-specific integrase [uncultured Desulfuromonas sp.]
MTTISLLSMWHDVLSISPVSEQIYRDHEHVIVALVAAFPGMSKGEVHQVLYRQDVERLCRTLRDKASVTSYSHRVTFLALLLEYGHKNLSWDVYIPSIPSTTKRPVNPFKEGHFGQDLVKKTQSALIKDLSSPAPTNETAKVGQILLAALLFGGVIEEKNLKKLMCHLPEAAEMCSGNSLIPLEEGQNDLVQYWISDPLTKTLLDRAGLKEEDTFSFNNVSSATVIQKYLRKFGPELKVKIAELRQQVKIQLFLTLPPFLVHHAEGQLSSTALPIATWQRLLTSKALNLILQAEEVKPSSFLTAFDTTAPCTLSAPGRQQLLLWKKLQKKLGRENSHAEFRRSIEQFLAQEDGNIYPALYYLCQWGIDLMRAISKDELKSYPFREASKLRPSSALKYMGDIARYLLTAAQDDGLLSLDEREELEDIYQETCSLAEKNKINKRRKISAVPISQRCAESLRRFHGFLQYRFGASNVDFSTLIHDGKAVHVDANLISYIEYERLLDVLSGSGELSRLQRIQRLVVILGFRCGLRRGECLRLRLCDFHPGENPVLLIRTSHYGRTKTRSSARQLPLKALLGDQFLQEFLALYHDRKMESADHEALLLSGIDDDHHIDPALIFTPIRMALHQVTGDNSLRYHHLRHSFANWIFLRLLRPDFEPGDAPFLDHDDFSLASCQMLRYHLLGGQNQSRKILSETARLLGHESPKTTLHSYVHILDWLLARYLSTPPCEPSLSVKALSTLTGLDQDKIYYRQSKCRKDLPSEHRWYLSDYLPFVKSKLDTLQIPTTTPNIAPLPNHAMKSESFLKLQVAIPAALFKMAQGKDINKLEKQFHIPASTLIAWQSMSDAIAGILTSRKIPRHINIQTRENGYQVFPPPVNSKVEKNLQRRIFIHVAEFNQEEILGLKKFLCHFLQHYSISDKGITLRDINLVGHYAKRLQILGIMQKEICVTAVLFAPKSMSLQEKSSFSKQTQSELSKQVGRSVHVVLSEQETKKQEHITYTIKVIDPTDQRNEERDGIFYANYGFRSALYLLAIALLQPQDLNR